jgi:polysaccharide chain length determinant protein (PEP-CTERM system associated)
MASPQTYISISRRPPDIEDYIDMLRRYRSWIIGPAFAGLVISVVVAFLWPNTYISQAVMRITPQQVSERLLPSVLSTQMQDRIFQMRQEILSRTSLIQIIQKPSLDLYKKDRERLSVEDVVQIMNKHIQIQTIADNSAPSDGRRPYAAFFIQFSYPDRYKAQAVVQELVGKFMEQNVTVQRAAAQVTEGFLTDEVKNAKEKLDASDAALTRFRLDNQGRLPDQLQSNMSAQSQIQMQIASLDDALGRDQQDKLLLETQLRNVRNQINFANSNLEETATGPAAVKNQRLIDLNNRIAEARSNLAGLRQIFKDDYPDIQQFKARIGALEKERDDLEKEEDQKEKEQTAKGVPAKVIVNPQVRKSLEDLKNEMAMVTAQISTKQADIESKMKRQSDLNRTLSAYQSRIEGTTVIEQQYLALQRDYNIAKSDYEDMMKRKGVSETARNLEEHKAGENLEQLDPPSLPEQPAEPNRWAIVGAGTIMGLMCGVVLAGAREVKNTTLKNLKDVRAYTNLPVLSSVPLLENALLVRRKRRLFWLAWSGAVILGTLAMSGSMYYYFFIGRT